MINAKLTEAGKLAVQDAIAKLTELDYMNTALDTPAELEAWYAVVEKNLVEAGVAFAPLAEEIRLDPTIKQFELRPGMGLFQVSLDERFGTFERITSDEVSSAITEAGVRELIQRCQGSNIPVCPEVLVLTLLRSPFNRFETNQGDVIRFFPYAEPRHA